MQRNLTEKLLAGAVAGVVASWAMSEFQNLWVKASGDRHSFTRPRTDEDLMAMIAGRVARKLGVPMKRRHQHRLGPLMHYSFGAGLGAVYSVLAAESELFTKGSGAAFGTAFFAIADSLAPRKFKPSVRPHSNRVVSELYEWLAHVVYGIALETGRKAAIAAMTVTHGDDTLWDERFAA